jgi:hypothetical protein
MKKGEKYECSNPDCGCEITVTRSSEAPDPDRSPTCCCGEEMTVIEKERQSAGGSR